MLLQDAMRPKNVLTVTTGECPVLCAKQPHDSIIRAKSFAPSFVAALPRQALGFTVRSLHMLCVLAANIYGNSG